MNKIFALIGPSGAGKGTFSKIFEEFGIKRSISATTRKKREGEVNGVNYFFINEKDPDFLDRLEKSPANDFHRGVYYFTEEDQFRKEDNVFCEMSRKGIIDLKKFFGNDNVVVIYIYANPEECEERITKRNGEEYSNFRMKHNFSEKSFDDIDVSDYVICNSSLNDINKNKEILRKIIRMEMIGKIQGMI